MKTIKLNRNFYGFTAVALATLGLASCSNELNEPNLGGNNGIDGISLAKLPEVKAWSGSENLGNLTRGDVNPSFTKWQSDTKIEGWPETTDRDEQVSTAEKEYVMGYLADHPDEGYTEVDLSTYFLQNVGGSYQSYHLSFMNGDQEHHSTDITGSNQMDYLVINGHHVNDYNATYGPRVYVENLPLVNPTYHDSYASLTLENKYRFYYIPNENGEGYSLYLCFDYSTSKYDNGQLDFPGDGVYNDWVIKILPGDGSAVVPPSEQGGNSPGHDDEDEDKDGDEGNDDNDEIIAVKTTSEVEVNLAINDYDPNALTEEGLADIITKLSIHVRAATDVKVVIPVPGTYLCDADDLIILEKHLEDLTAHGGTTTQNVVSYKIGDKNITLHSVIDFVENNITVWTDGIDQDILDYCIAKNKDGINFEIWNYFNNSAFKDFENAKEELQQYLNDATVEFLDSYPDYYINAFNKTETGDKFEWDCTVSHVHGTQFGDAVEGWHLNSSLFNLIYKNEDFDGEDGEHDHEFIWGSANTEETE